MATSKSSWKAVSNTAATKSLPLLFENLIKIDNYIWYSYTECNAKRHSLRYSVSYVSFFTKE